jgi:hypothetical protein
VDRARAAILRSVMMGLLAVLAPTFDRLLEPAQGDFAFRSEATPAAAPHAAPQGRIVEAAIRMR